MMISRRALLTAFAAASLPPCAGARIRVSLSEILFDSTLPVLGNPEVTSRSESSSIMPVRIVRSFIRT